MAGHGVLRWYTASACCAEIVTDDYNDVLILAWRKAFWG